MSTPASAPPDPAPDSVADRIAVDVVAVPGVHALHAGAHGEVATYLPGRRVLGVRVREETCAVHVVLEWGAPLLETTERVRAAARARLADGSKPVDVVVEDVVAPDDASAPGATTGRPRIGWRR